jgi:hypothetical protein
LFTGLLALQSPVAQETKGSETAVSAQAEPVNDITLQTIDQKLDELIGRVGKTSGRTSLYDLNEREFRELKKQVSDLERQVKGLENEVRKLARR